ncbi:MAG TPA: hypothetical protein VKB84_21705 [Candidatus Binataceae bacterium]|jgi:hypothetical protein|nr:hypothetical protein [Candidatus Binataceae bacterium]
MKKSDRSNAEELKKQLEAAAGHPIDIDAEQLIKIFMFPVGALDYTPQDGNGSVKWRGLIIPITSCNPATLLDASGSLSTGADGQRTFLLSQEVCLPLQRSLAEPVNVVATARSTTPFFVTTTHSLVQDDPANPLSSDVQITVFTWNASGAPAPNVTFDWRCRAVSNTIIF